MDNFAVFGNPIHHSKSPIIHNYFSIQTGIPYKYNSILVPIKDFCYVLSDFFLQGGKGANITLPFKQQAWKFADELTERASLAGAVNTLKINKNGKILGDNTDGIGLISDLKRLNMLKINDKILIIGAGGAARGAIFPLLSLGCSVTLTNRTFEKAQALAKICNKYNKIIEIIPLNKLNYCYFDLIINATSSGIGGQFPQLPISIINSSTCCYDMFYHNDTTPFLKWCQQKGAKNLADGLGMLVGQAAHSVYFWYGIMPEITPVIMRVKNLT